MPIKVSCKCGQSFAAKDELAGKAVKCPKCGQPLRIPSPQQPPAAAAAGGALSDLFDEVGIGAHVEDDRAMCPGCGTPLPHNAILCVACGLNLQSGRQLRGVGGKAQAAASAEGHGAAAASLLAKAEKALAESPMDKAGATKDSWWMPWATMLALCAAAGLAFLVWMAFSTWINAPVSEETTTTAATSRIPYFLFLGLMGLGSILVMVSSIMIAVYAFKNEDNPVHGIMCLLINLYAVIYGAMRLNKLEREVKLWCFGMFCYVAGVTTLMFTALMAASGGQGMQLTPERMGLFMLGLIYIFLMAAGVTMMSVGWIWSVVLGFLDRWYHGALAIIYPFYGGLYVILRKGEHPAPAKIWLYGMGSIFGAIALMVFMSMVFAAADQEVGIVVFLVAIGIVAGIALGPPIALTLLNSGLIYGAMGIHNLLFGATKKDRVKLPSFGTVFGMAFGLTVVTYYMAPPFIMSLSAGALTNSIAGFLVVAFFALAIIYFPPFVFVLADMTVVNSETQFKQGIMVGVIYLVEGIVLMMVAIASVVLSIGLQFMSQLS